MTLPKIKPCPKCLSPVDVYTYDSGWRRVDCDHCDYISEPAENRLQAIRNHNRPRKP